MMRKSVFLGLVLIVALSVLSACGVATEDDADQQILATINGYRLSLSAFQRQLASELELEEDYKLTQDAKKEFLESLISKELLIQEAVRLKLDRRAAFTKAIEKHWESTLIRDLITMKSQEIVATIYVSEEEINDRYEILKQSMPTIGPLTDTLQQQLRQELKADKKTQRLNGWIEDLKKQATIEIDDELLASH